jgi:hypothetical protein
MSADSAHRRYVLIFAAACAAVLLPVLVLNFLLGLRSLGGTEAVLAASRWQRATHGVTYAPPLSVNRPFKSARLFDRLTDINGVVFGSSTMMGITDAMFPPRIAVYNFSQTGNELPLALGEAAYLQQQHPRALKLAVLPLDWALGFLYRSPGALGPLPVAPPAADAPAVRNEVPLLQQLGDALSLPRVKNLSGILRGIARAPAPAAAFREMFLQDSSDDYRCADGTPARDFDTIFRGTCTGFRYDGSATFANVEPVPPRRATALIASALVPSSKYAADLIKSGGAVQPLLLERLAELARDLRRSGGRLLLILPPLLPGMERAFIDSPQLGPLLARTKQTLARWAKDNDVVIIDAGQSERYGCTAPEFVDEHHALSTCYARIFARFWNAGGSTKLAAGLFAPD